MRSNKIRLSETQRSYVCPRLLEYADEADPPETSWRVPRNSLSLIRLAQMPKMEDGEDVDDGVPIGVCCCRRFSFGTCSFW